jgi:protein-tyrosine-phosphatase
MAAQLAIQYAALRGRQVDVDSASVLGLNDKPAHKHAIKVCEEIGLALAEHRSKPVYSEQMAWADHVLCMEINHAAVLRERFPEFNEKLLLLGSFAGLVEIEDPLGGWRGRFRQCRDQLKTCVHRFIDAMPEPA